MLTKKQQTIKRLFDVLVSLVGLAIFFIPLLILLLLATIFTGRFGLFSQERVGQHARPFVIYKVRSMLDSGHIGVFGKVLRSSKLDELPQLYNVLMGTMSLVGPRPDIKGYADMLDGDDRMILAIKPGITGPATIKYKHEDELLTLQPEPEKYNDTVIWPDKVKINREYVENWSFIQDLKYIIQTFFT